MIAFSFPQFKTIDFLLKHCLVLIIEPANLHQCSGQYSIYIKRSRITKLTYTCENQLNLVLLMSFLLLNVHIHCNQQNVFLPNYVFHRNNPYMYEDLCISNILTFKFEKITYPELRKKSKHEAPCKTTLFNAWRKSQLLHGVGQTDGIQ